MVKTGRSAVASLAQSVDIAKPISYIFYLVHGYPLIAFSSAIDVLRLANVALGYSAYEWRVAPLMGDLSNQVPASTSRRSAIWLQNGRTLSVPSGQEW